MIDTTSNPTLMLNFKCEVSDITTIDLTGDEAILRYPHTNTSAAAPSHPNHSQDAHDESFLGMAP